MTHLRVVKTTAELQADEARARLTHALHNMGLTEGQVSRLAALILSYGVAQFEAGLSRADVPSPRGAA